MGNSITIAVYYDARCEKIDVNIEKTPATSLMETIKKGVLINDKWKLDPKKHFLHFNLPQKHLAEFSPSLFNDCSVVVKGKYEIVMSFNRVVMKSKDCRVGNLAELNEVVKQTFRLNEFHLCSLNEKKEETKMEKLLGFSNELFIKVYNEYACKVEQEEKVEEFSVRAYDYEDFEVKILEKFGIKKKKEIYLKVQLDEKWKNIDTLEVIKGKNVNVKIVKNFKLVLEGGFDSLF